MDTSQYKKEIAKLERELADINVDKPSGSSKTFSSLGKYKSYIIILIGSFILILLIKPKFTLMIKTINDNPTIVVDKKKFILTWLGTAIVISFIYFLLSKKKSG